MKPEQIQLVKSSFLAASTRRPDFAERFYEHLFAADPSLRTLFKGDIRTQAAKLGSAIAMVVHSLDRLDEIMEPVRQMAIRHVGYGVEEGHYATVGQALIATLRETLGDSFTAETEAAWTTAYVTLSGAMIASAAEATRDAA
jgi:nitric oxide dioxygenase